MNERLVWKGQREEKKLEIKKLEASISGLRSSIRVELNPHSPIKDIDHGQVAQQAMELSQKLIRYRQLSEEIVAINKSLGSEK